MEWLGFLCSGALVLTTARIAALRLGSDWRERFWIMIATATASIGASATVLSLVHGVRPLPFLLVQFALLVGAFFLPCARAGFPRRRSSGAWPRLVVAALGAIVLLIGLERLFLPVSNIDDRNYRASRAAYWLEEQTLVLQNMHNDRLVAFPPGGSLPFFWAILFTRNEIAGLIATWLAYPLVGAGLYALLREARLSREASALGALVFCFTPIVLLHTRGVQPEMWLALYTVGCAAWALRAAHLRRSAPKAFLFAGLFAVLAMNIRATALPLVLAVLIVAPLIARRDHWRAFGAALAGCAVALALSGLGLILVNNLRQFGHPLGSAQFRHVHAADITGIQIRTHADRAVVALLELPLLPNEQMREWWDHVRDNVLAALGADRWLPLEEKPWPGHWEPIAAPWAENYSLPGWLWLPAMLAALVGAARQIVRAPAGRRLGPASVLGLLSAPFLLGVIFAVRWMGLMPRFWIAPYALGVAMIAVLLGRAARRRPWIGRVAAALIVLFVVPAAFVRARAFQEDVTHPPPDVALDEPYAEPLADMPDPARILLAAGQGTRDYPLFRPRDGFVNEVFSWGKQPFDARRMRELIDRRRITHVIIENDRQLALDWDPPIATGSMAAWLAAQLDFREVHLQYTPGMRQFERINAAGK